MRSPLPHGVVFAASVKHHDGPGVSHSAGDNDAGVNAATEDEDIDLTLAAPAGRIFDAIVFRMWAS